MAKHALEHAISKSSVWFSRYSYLSLIINLIFPELIETILNDKIIINCLQIHIQYIPREKNNILADYKT